MKKLASYLLGFVLTVLFGISIGVLPHVMAAAPPALRNSVAVCDPNIPSNCVAPDSAGNQPISLTGTVSYSSTGALAANQVVKASAGNLYSFQVSADATLSGAAWWIMIYDATAAPSDGAVTPAKCYAVASGTTGYAAAFLAPVAFTNGIVIGVSTTGCFSKTASTHAFISGDAK